MNTFAVYVHSMNIYLLATFHFKPDMSMISVFIDTFRGYVYSVDISICGNALFDGQGVL